MSSDSATISPPRRGSLLVIFLTVFIDLLGFGMVLPLMPVYAESFVTDRSGLTIGLLMASFSAMQLIFAPIWGRLSDRIGRRPVLMVGLAGSVVFYSLFGIATVMKSVALLFVARIGAGIAGATVSTAQAYISDTTTLEGRTKGMALIGAAFGLGFTFGPLFGSLALPSGNSDPSPGPGYAAAGLSFVALMLAYFVLPESLTSHGKASEHAWFNPQALRDAIATPSIAALLVTLFICVFAFANFEVTLSMMISGERQVALAETTHVVGPLDSPFHFTLRQVCWTFAYIGLSLTFAQGVLVRRLSGKVSDLVLASAGAVTEILGFALLVIAIRLGSEVWLFVALTVTVSGFALMMPTINSLISRRSDPAKQGGILGVAQSTNALARILGPIVAVPLLKRDLTLPYWTGAALMGLGLLMVLYAVGRGRDYAPAGSAPPQMH